CTSDRDLADRYWGPERTPRAYPWRTLLERGAVLAFGSDAPVEPIDPLLGIHAAVTRRRRADREAWFPAQRLTLDEALHGYTAGAAYATGREREWGTLEVGMRCDATVVDRDLAKLKEDELLETRIRDTRKEIGTKRLERHGRAVESAVAVGLVEIADLTDEVRLHLGHQGLHREATLSASDDVGAPVRQERLRHDLGLGPDGVRLRAR